MTSSLVSQMGTLSICSEEVFFQFLDSSAVGVVTCVNVLKAVGQEPTPSLENALREQLSLVSGFPGFPANVHTPGWLTDVIIGKCGQALQVPDLRVGNGIDVNLPVVLAPESGRSNPCPNPDCDYVLGPLEACGTGTCFTMGPDVHRWATCGSTGSSLQTAMHGEDNIVFSKKAGGNSTMQAEGLRWYVILES